MIWNAFLLAIRQIWRNPMRSLLTVLGVVIGVAAVITMVTLGNGATTAIREEIESFGNNQIMLRPGMRLGPGQKVGAPDFKTEDARALMTQLVGVVAVAPQTSKSMTIVANGRNWQTSVIGTDANYFEIDNRELSEGRYFEEGEERSESFSTEKRASSGKIFAREAFPAASSDFSKRRVRRPWVATRTIWWSCP